MEDDILVQNCGSCSFDDATLLRGICAQPTTGYNAFVFMSLIELIIKSQCAISDPCRRAKSPDKTDDRQSRGDEYDFIVVGGGVAGSVVASRLSENSMFKVLLLEAGPEEPTITAVPAFAFSAANTSFDWQYETVPQKRACLSTNGVCKWPRGKMLCGTACLSGLMYTRGHPAIYDTWAKTNDGWSYNDVLRYFKKSETNTEPRREIDAQFHGFDGPLSVGRFPYLPDLASDILDAAKELGFRVGDPNGYQQEAFTIAPIMVKDGLLASPARMYLRPALHRPNLRVLIESHATRVIFDDSCRRAVAVEYADKWGRTRTVRAAKEIILSGGVVGSAQLLLLSGVGPKRDLRKLGVDVVRDLPVGRNLHYHVGFTISVRMAGKNTNGMTMKSLREFITNRTGPFASTGLTQVTSFYTSKYAAAAGVPDIQLYLDGYNPKCRNRDNQREYSDVTFRPIYLLSKCRGVLKLASTDPHDKPLIHPNYLCDEREVETLIEAVELVKNLTQTSALKSKVKKFDVAENARCAHLRAKCYRDYWQCVIREYTNGENHHSGTCKMGPVDDPTAVVDHQLRVHRVPNLRVVDASVFPTPINCNTIAPTVMVAEKASDMILMTWQ